jgi:CDP-4-dehydro-6-deoxyglucose reductase, E1
MVLDNKRNALNWPLMQNNITAKDLNAVVDYIKDENNLILTQSTKVNEFEKKWSEWLGVKHSVFVNSGSSANLITIAAVKEIYGSGEIILPPITWVSDIASVIQNGFVPVFSDISIRTLGMDTQEILKKITPRTKAVFLTHILGYNALTEELLLELKKKDIILIEDVCESHGATFNNKKLGTFGLVSNFSFFYAHHMSTIEGGMVCTNDEKIYQYLRMFRSHGMVREATDISLKNEYNEKYPDLRLDFIFAFPAYNVRSTEINAIIGLNQLKRLDLNNVKRKENFKIFLNNLDPNKYITEFDDTGSCNYAFTLVLRKSDKDLCDRVINKLKELNVEFRRGTSGGGNQLRQPYLRKLMGEHEHEKYPNAEHLHFFGFYIGNYPDLEKEKIIRLCDVLNIL